MADSATQIQVVAAARSLDKDEFTREDVANELGMEIEQMQPSWKAAKQAGEIEKVSDEGGKRLFKVSAE
jgi:hypothetical protein